MGDSPIPGGNVPGASANSASAQPDDPPKSQSPTMLDSDPLHPDPPVQSSPPREEAEKFIKPLSIEAIVAIVIALINLALDQADIHIMIISWISVIACIGLSIDALRRTRWSARVGYRSKPFVSCCTVVAAIFIAFGVSLSLHTKSYESESRNTGAQETGTRASKTGTPRGAPAVSQPDKPTFEKQTASAPVVHPFPAKPLMLLDFSKPLGGSIQNLSNEPLYILNLSMKVEMPIGDYVYSLPIDKMAGPHKTIAFTSTQQGTYSAPDPYSSSDWGKTLADLQAQYKQCLQPTVFVPDAHALNEIVANFAKRKAPLPIGDATGEITYRRGLLSKDEPIPLKAILLKEDGCVPRD
jgi:hypothetical protein